MKLLSIFLISMLAISCASYQTKAMDTSIPARNHINKQSIHGLSIAAEDYSSEEQSTELFFRDLKEYGYLPVFIAVDNVGEYEFTLKLDNVSFRYEDGTEAQIVHVKKVIKECQTNGAVSLLALPLLIFPTIAIWSSISETNEKLEEDYERKALRSFHIPPGDELFGFVFFKIPKGKSEASLEDSTLQVSVIKKAKDGELAENLDLIVSVSQDSL